MPRPKAAPPVEPTETLTIDRLRVILKACGTQKEAVEIEAEHLADLFKAAKPLGVQADAAKLALRMTKWEPEKVRAWRECFDQCVVALGLDAQGDFEDVLRSANPAPPANANALVVKDGLGDVVVSTRRRPPAGEATGPLPN